MSTNALARVAYREAGRATVCEVLYGPNVLKHAVIDAEAGEGEVVTFSGMPLPIDCRPPAGRRRGEQVGVVPDKLIDSHGVFAYAGIAAERIALEGSCHETDVIRAFRAFFPRYRFADMGASADGINLTDARVGELVKSWNVARGRPATRTSAGFWKGLSLVSRTDRGGA